jgi:energy-coupling factor transport system ATP-binding protein
LLQNVETQIFTDRVSEEIVFGLENWNIASSQIPTLVNHALDEFGLQAQRHWSISQLSAGQKQRLVLGAMLAIGQPVLLLDEPLAYLDARGVALLVQLLRDRAQQGQSIVLVEHRLDIVQKICDRAFYFVDGQLQAGWRSLPTVDGANPMNQPPSISQTHVLCTRQLSWGGYPAFPDLTISAGETLFLKADNGCGKTTLLKLLSGLLKPTTGSIEVLGQDITQRSVIQRSQQIGFVLQNPNHQLFADSVRSEVLQPGVSPSLAEALLTELNLHDFADKHPQALSQGQKRRLALAAVLARQPQICLLDEIVVGQDPHSLSLMLKVLKQFTQHGGAVILTSHDPLAAAALNARAVEL